MARSTWEALPAPVRAAIEREAGTVVRAEIPSAGRNSDFSATLHTSEGPVFCKGIAGAEGRRGRMHRHEAEVNPWLPSAVAPRLWWRAEVDGWLLLGFDHAAGRHADLAPGSADLPVVAEAVTTLARELAHCPASAPLLAEQWGRLAAWRRLARNTPADLDPWAREHLHRLIDLEGHAIEAADGDSLVHTDLHPLNILVDGGRARIVDWAWSRTGAAAVDVAFLVARLVAAGHTPVTAELWARGLPAWRETPATTRTAFAVAIWGMWEFLERDSPLPHRAELTAAARRWARHRLADTPRPRHTAEELVARHRRLPSVDAARMREEVDAFFGDDDW
ncbi:phosphotransferase [Prauserella flavalba]|uniref:phosphotransferase n=1 Tax=Prauserella flavalba TaxID=1477506 RepID=UPI001FE5A899|nr:phosphotransferase [Prauserella flavalba]